MVQQTFAALQSMARFKKAVRKHWRNCLFQVFSRLNIWIILCLFASTSAQEVTSTLPASNHTCPGTRITFNCSIIGSVSVTNLIIAWSSPEYIGQGAFLQFNTDSMIGDSVTSMINDDVTAQLVHIGDRSRTPTLESQLQLTASSNFMNPNITCWSLTSGSMRSITFYILSIPGSPHNAKGTEVPIVDGRCVLFLTWDTPLDYDEKDIDNYFVKGPFDVIQTKEKSKLVSLNIPRCISDLNVNVSAVDHCGREGPSTVIVVQLDSSEKNKTLPTQQVTSPQENQSELEVAAISVAVIGIILTMLTVMAIVVLVFYICNCSKEYEALSQDTRKLILDEQPNLESNDDPESKIVDGQTALHLTSNNSLTDVVKLLIISGAQIDNKDENGWTALHLASISGHTDVVKLLVDSGAQIDNKDKDGVTALHCASNSGHTDVVKLLIGSGAQIDNKGKDGRTALHHALISGHTDVVKLLVDSGAQIDNKDKYGKTALHLASNSGHTDVVKLLVDSGAQIDNEDKHGQTALHLASSSGHTDVVKLLVDSDAQIDNKDRNGRTVLNRASNSGHTDVVNLHIDSGAQVDSEDNLHEYEHAC